MMLCLIQCCVDIVAHVVRVVQAREVVPPIVLEIDARVVVILVLLFLLFLPLLFLRLPLQVAEEEEKQERYDTKDV